MDLVAIARRMLEERGFKLEPPETAVMAPSDGAPLVDLRALPWSSIDGNYTRDLDQIEYAEQLDRGRMRLLVGIADVAAYVPAGEALDRHAHRNALSLYMGVRTYPMLPRTLADEHVSLVEGAERRAVVVEMIVGEDGVVDDDATRVMRARVVNRARLAYDRVGTWLDGDASAAPADPAIAAQVRLHDELSRRLRAQRAARGALDIDVTETRAVIKGDCVVDLELLHRTRAHEIIEDLMIATNGATAAFLRRRGYAALRRVVDAPQRWDRIVDLARERGHALPDAADVRALGAFVAARRAVEAPNDFADLSYSIVKLLGPGAYALHDGGHFGLAAQDYGHSTAPMRRYADLVTQRLLHAALAGTPSPYGDVELVELAAHCTGRENLARKIERTMRKIQAATLLANRIGEQFEALVTAVGDSGTFVRLCAPPVAEGRIVDGREHGLDVGARLRVRLVATKPTSGFIDFVPVAAAPGA